MSARIAGIAIGTTVPSMNPMAEASTPATTMSRRFSGAQKPETKTGPGVFGACSSSETEGRFKRSGLTGRGRLGRGHRRPAAAARQRIVLALHGTLEMGAALDRDGLVDDVAFDTGGGGQAHLEPADPADDPPVDHHV